MNRYTVRVTWAEVVQHAADVTVHANREDDAIAVAHATVRNGGTGRAAINATVTSKAKLDGDDAVVTATPMPEHGPANTPGRRNHHEGNTE